jgi:hypothetical protein
LYPSGGVFGVQGLLMRDRAGAGDLRGLGLLRQLFIEKEEIQLFRAVEKDTFLQVKKL